MKSEEGIWIWIDDFTDFISNFFPFFQVQPDNETNDRNYQTFTEGPYEDQTYSDARLMSIVKRTIQEALNAFENTQSTRLRCERELEQYDDQTQARLRRFFIPQRAALRRARVMYADLLRQYTTAADRRQGSMRKLEEERCYVVKSYFSKVFQVGEQSEERRRQEERLPLRAPNFEQLIEDDLNWETNWDMNIQQHEQDDTRYEEYNDDPPTEAGPLGASTEAGPSTAVSASSTAASTSSTAASSSTARAAASTAALLNRQNVSLNLLDDYSLVDIEEIHNVLSRAHKQLRETVVVKRLGKNTKSTNILNTLMGNYSKLLEITTSKSNLFKIAKTVEKTNEMEKKTATLLDELQCNPGVVKDNSTRVMMRDHYFNLTTPSMEKEYTSYIAAKQKVARVEQRLIKRLDHFKLPVVSTGRAPLTKCNICTNQYTLDNFVFNDVCEHVCCKSCSNKILESDNADRRRCSFCRSELQTLHHLVHVGDGFKIQTQPSNVPINITTRQ